MAFTLDCCENFFVLGSNYKRHRGILGWRLDYPSFEETILFKQQTNKTFDSKSVKSNWYIAAQNSSFVKELDIKPAMTDVTSP